MQGFLGPCRNPDLFRNLFGLWETLKSERDKSKFSMWNLSQSQSLDNNKRRNSIIEIK